MSSASVHDIHQYLLQLRHRYRLSLTDIHKSMDIIIQNFQEKKDFDIVIHKNRLAIVTRVS